MTIKATSLLSIAAIWAAMVPAVIAERGSWWALIFAALATATIGAGAWRRLGLSRLIAITLTWAGAGVALGTSSDAAWTAVFAFLTTGAIVFSVMRRDDVATGAAIGFPWLVTGAAVAKAGTEAAWVCIFAFLTAGALANHRGATARALAAIGWWAAAGAVMLIAEDHYWLSVGAFLLSASAFGLGGFRFPTRLEWDLFDRDPRD